jgi:hypothetical protein
MKINYCIINIIYFLYILKNIKYKKINIKIKYKKIIIKIKYKKINNKIININNIYNINI